MCNRIVMITAEAGWGKVSDDDVVAQGPTRHPLTPYSFASAKATIHSMNSVSASTTVASLSITPYNNTKQ